MTIREIAQILGASVHTAEEELLESFMFDDEEGTVPDNSDLLSDDYAGEDDGYDYE